MSQLYTPNRSFGTTTSEFYLPISHEKQALQLTRPAGSPTLPPSNPRLGSAAKIESEGQRNLTVQNGGASCLGWEASRPPSYEVPDLLFSKGRKKKHWVSHNAWALEDENKARIRVPDLDGRGVYVCSECDDRAISPDDGHNAATRIVT